MCGLYGTFGNIPKKLSTFYGLALANMARGTHSTGYADIDTRSNRTIIRKGPVDAKTFLPFFKMAEGNLLLGHTRHATCGKINTANAHPWKIGRLVGAHNGIVMNEWSVKKYLKDVHSDNASYEVDSQYLIHMMDRYGHMGNATGMLNLVYWSLYRRSLNFVVSDNPMNIAMSKDFDWLAWSSDKSHLETVLKSSGLEDAVIINSLKDETLEVKLNRSKCIDVESGKPPFDEEHRKIAIAEDRRWTNYYNDDYGDGYSYNGRSNRARSTSSSLPDANMLGKVFPGTDGSTWQLTNDGWKKTERDGTVTIVSQSGKTVTSTTPTLDVAPFYGD